MSNRFHFRLTGWKSLTETEPNDLSEQAQSVTAPLSVNGMIEDTDDADFFRFHAETGETIAFQVLLGRNGYATGGEIGNVTLTLMDTAGHVLGASFSHFIWDPYLQHDFEKKGDYLLAVEHKRLAVTCFVTECENKRLDETYQLLIGRSPVLWSVWPPAGRRGTTVEAQLTADFVNVKTPLEFSGRGLRARTLSADGVSPTRLQLAIEIDPDAEPGKHFLRVPDESGSLSPLVFLVYDEELSREQEPNNSLESSPVLSVPSLFLGRIDEPGDIDSFAFQANERDRLVFQLDARKVGSSMFDPHVAVLAADGDIVGINDDQPSFYNPRNRDAKLELQIPGAPNCAQRSDRFFLQVRDTSKHSGEGLFYLLRARKQTPDFELAAPSDRIFVERGGEATVSLRLRRLEGFLEDVTVVVDGLPPSVVAKPLVIRATKAAGDLKLQAAETTDLTTTKLSIRGVGKNGEEEIVREAVIPQSTLGDGFAYADKRREELHLSVVPPTPFSLERIHANGQAARTLLSLSGARKATVLVKVQRRDSVDQPLTLSFEGLPEGIDFEEKEWTDEGTIADVMLRVRDGARLKPAEYRVAVVGTGAAGQREAGESFYLRLEP